MTCTKLKLANCPEAKRGLVEQRRSNEVQRKKVLFSSSAWTMLVQLVSMTEEGDIRSKTPINFHSGPTSFEIGIRSIFITDSTNC